MPTIARLIGGAGTGKTTRLLQIMEQVISSGIDPMTLGFCSFTRAARREAAERAASRFDIGVKVLENEGWFKTLHSICYRCLGVTSGELLTGDKESTRWLEEALETPVASSGGDSDVAFAESPLVSDNHASASLGLWQASRNRLEPLADTWSRAEACDDRTPPLEYVRGIVERFEQAKRLAGRFDFVDLLGRFAGWRFGLDGHEPRNPDGWVPDIPVWFFDEQQDTSALLDAVCRRLMQNAKWVYVCGDPFQSIYNWAGADASYFMGWEVAKQDIMPKSYRCPREILDLGEEILRDCADYFDRGIAPADHEGEVETSVLNGGMFDEVDPRESWLILARSNAHAKRLSAFLDRRGIPWLPTRGSNHWNAPKTRAAILGLYGLEKHDVMEGEEWRGIIDKIPSKLDGEELLVRGTKSRYDEPGEIRQIAGRVFRRDEIAELGATPRLIELIRSGTWRTFVDNADRFIDAVERFGYEAAEHPQVIVSTVHASKGMEADNVIWLTTTSEQTHKAMQTEDGADAERRVNYVAATRARKRLIVARERARYMAEVPV